MADVIMPKMSEAMKKGLVIQWLKGVGEAVNPDDPIVEIETDIAILEINADVRGIIQSVRFGPGATVSVGEVMATITVRP